MNVYPFKLNSRVFLTLIGVAVLTVSACASTAPVSPAPTETIPLFTATSTLASPAPEASPVSTMTAAPQFVPTSRGPNLEATDPTTVVLASGGLQLVEFFRFT